MSDTDQSGRMILRSSTTSPFGRKTRMAVLIHGLQDRVTLVPADTLDPNDSLRSQNPLGKIPCLILADGGVLFDSRVIVEYFDSISDQPPLLPRSGRARFEVLTRAVLADGITDAALLMVYEGRFREPQQHSERWLEHQRGKVRRGLAAIGNSPPPIAQPDLSSLALACALAYLDWRKPM
ncbi:MAG: glutathione S-transferase N-terminal domain-containing protein, partial [Quisquiliibacterium sp.]